MNETSYSPAQARFVEVGPPYYGDGSDARYCPCGFHFGDYGQLEHIAHRTAHLDRGPDVDAGTRRNLDLFIGWAR